MAVIINEFEVEPRPEAGSSPETEREQSPDLSINPLDIRDIHYRQQCREQRLRAH